MRKICKIKQQVKIGDNDWFNTSGLYNIHYCELIENAEKEYSTFEKLQQGILNNDIVNGYIDYSLFTHKPIVYISKVFRDCSYKITEKNFQPVSVRLVYTEYKHYTLADVLKFLPSEDAIEYFKDNGIIFEKSIDKLKKL